jgi:hypothetical protein
MGIIFLDPRELFYVQGVHFFISCSFVAGPPCVLLLVKNCHKKTAAAAAAAVKKESFLN